MHRQARSTYTWGKKRLGFIALVLCVCFIIAFISSAAFIAARANHIHNHDGPDGVCTTCGHMVTAENLLKQFCAAAVISATAVLCFLPHRTPVQTGGFGVGFYSLVGQKVKLNN